MARLPKISKYWVLRVEGASALGEARRQVRTSLRCEDLLSPWTLPLWDTVRRPHRRRTTYRPANRRLASPPQASFTRSSQRSDRLWHSVSEKTEAIQGDTSW